MKASPKRGLMGTRFECQNGARSMAHKDHKAADRRRRWTPADYRDALEEAEERESLTKAERMAEDWAGLS